MIFILFLAQMIQMGQQFFFKIPGFGTNLCKLVDYESSECGHLFLERLNAENCHAVIQTFWPALFSTIRTCMINMPDKYQLTFWACLVNVGGIEDACRVFNRTWTIYLTVENVTFLGLFKCRVQGQKVVAFPPQIIHRDEMELNLITFRRDLDCVRI